MKALHLQLNREFIVVEKIVEVPQVQVIEKIVEKIVEITQVPTVEESVEKVIEVPKVDVNTESIEKSIEASGVAAQPIHEPVQAQPIIDVVLIDGYPVHPAVARQLQEFPLRVLRQGERFRGIVGHATPDLSIRYGVVVRQGYNRFKDQCRVLFDEDNAEQWEDRSKCWPDSASNQWGSMGSSPPLHWQSWFSNGCP